MADITGFIKDYAEPLGRFLKKQFGIWLSVVASPRNFISGINIRSKDAVLPSIYFAVFVYMASIFISTMGLFAYGNVDVLDTLFLVSDFVLTFICFCLIGLTLYVIGKGLGGSGGVRESMVAGFYLSAVWPILQIADYFLSPNLSFLDDQENAILKFATLLIFTTGFACFLTVKFHPVVAHVHGFGRARAIVASVLQIVILPALILVFLGEHFQQLLARP